jgi:hypothetical protein
MRSLSSSLEETLAQLDRLHAAETSRKANDLARLSDAVGRLGVGTQAEPDAPSAPHGAPGADMDRALRVAPEPETPLLPRRTTHGGPFGTSIIDRVAANVRKASDW